jgi:antirestriction protein ArdC
MRIHLIAIVSVARIPIQTEFLAGTPLYSREELVAELSAAYLCAEAGISNAVIRNQAAYVAGWLKKLRDNRKLLIHAAAQAQRAADYILGRNAKV